MPKKIKVSAAGYAKLPKMLPSSHSVTEGLVVVTLPIAITSATGGNSREHHMGKAKRVKDQRTTVANCLWNFLSASERRGWDFKAEKKTTNLPVRVKLVRVAIKHMDYGNMVHGLKAVQDGVADWLRCNDGDDSQAKWEFAEELTAKATGTGIRIELCETDAAWRKRRLDELTSEAEKDGLGY